MSFIYCFFTEWIIFLSLLYFFILAVGAKPSWNKLHFANFVYNQLILFLCLIGWALCVTEGHWHFVLLPAGVTESFYPTNLLTTSLLNFVAKLTLLLFTVACVLLHKPTVFTRTKVPLEYSILILLVTLASFLLISANNLAFAFVAMELQTLALVVFSFIGNAQKNVAVEAVLRYFVNAAFASVSLLFALSLLYALTGTLQIDQLIALFQSDVLSAIGADSFFFVLSTVSIILLFLAFFFKLTLAPFHHWVGDLYQGTAGYVGSYFTLVTKIPIWMLFIKTLAIFYTAPFGALLWTFQFIALFSLFLGNIYAFTEYNFRRFWAVGSIGHMGQILLSLLFMGSDSIFVATFYLLLYLSANTFFWGLLLQQEARPNFDLNFWEFFKSVFRLLSLQPKKLRLIFLFILASIAGVPPAFGFAAKLYLFLCLYQINSFFILAAVFFFNLISLSYYIRLMRLTFFQNAGLNAKDSLPVEEKQLKPLTLSIAWAFAILVLLHSFFGFWLLQIIFSAIVAF